MGLFALILTLFPVALYIFGIFGIYVLIKKLSSTDAKPKYHYLRKQYFMTARESECYKALMQAVGNQYVIFAQVHLSTIIDEKERGQNWKAARAHIDRKSVDFVLCDKENISPVLAIELDDWSHALKERKERDIEVERIFQQAKMPLLRITDTQNLAEKIGEKLLN